MKEFKSSAEGRLGVSHSKRQQNADANGMI